MKIENLSKGKWFIYKNNQKEITEMIKKYTGQLKKFRWIKYKTRDHRE